MKDRLIDDYWVEKIHEDIGINRTSEGDRIYYRDPSRKGFGHWRPGVILGRKPDIHQSGTITEANRYEIVDT